MILDAPLVAGDGMDSAIGAVYDAALAMDRWPIALGHLRSLFDLGSTAYVIHDATRSKVVRFAAEVDPDGHRANVDSLLKGSMLYRRAGTGRPGQIMRSAEMAPMAAFHRTRMYQKYWRPRDLYDGLRLTVAIDPGGVVHAINLIRPSVAGAFEPSHVALVARLMPHLRRAVVLRRQIGDADMLVAAALSALDTLPHGVLLLDRHGRAMHANAAAVAILSSEDGLRIRDRQLHAASPSLTNRLHAVLAAAAGRDGNPPRAGVLRLPRPAADSMLALLAMPFRQDTEWAWAGTPAVLLTVSAPYAVRPPTERVLTALFGLTAAEAALASALLSGLELKEIAVRDGRSLSTVRTLLARLMAKAEVGRQAELVRVLAAVPRLPGGS
jgi:DNA-binding CsgD family transcriptional regulator/PAS domain-containing protein